VPFLPKDLLDRLLQAASRLWPEVLPPRLLEFRDRFEHHLLLKMAGESVEEARIFLQGFLGEAGTGRAADWFACSIEEGNKAFLHRFAAAGAAIRYATVHRGSAEDMVALDIALPRNAEDWVEALPSELEAKCLARLYYGHFFCHVFHQDYVVRRGSDAKAVKAQLLDLLEARGAEYPAEHNVGHIYEAKPAPAAFYRATDPTNTFNPGIGKMPKLRIMRCDCHTSGGG
jgi:D-lactate dehydrogenase